MRHGRDATGGTKRRRHQGSKGGHSARPRTEAQPRGFHAPGLGRLRERSEEALLLLRRDVSAVRNGNLQPYRLWNPFLARAQVFEGGKGAAAAHGQAALGQAALRDAALGGASGGRAAAAAAAEPGLAAGGGVSGRADALARGAIVPAGGPPARGGAAHEAHLDVNHNFVSGRRVLEAVVHQLCDTLPQPHAVADHGQLAAVLLDVQDELRASLHSLFGGACGQGENDARVGV